MTEKLSKDAFALVEKATWPRNAKEEREGVEYKHAKDEVMSGRGSDAAKDEALRAIHKAAFEGRKGATHHSGSYIAPISRRIHASRFSSDEPESHKPKPRHNGKEKAALRKATAAVRAAERLEKKAKALQKKAASVKGETEAKAKTRRELERKAKDASAAAKAADKKAREAKRAAKKAAR